MQLLDVVRIKSSFQIKILIKDTNTNQIVISIYGDFGGNTLMQKLVSYYDLT